MTLKFRLRRSAAFSLVEVVIAIGVASFALVTIFGLFGGLMKTSGENIARREIVESVDALRKLLQNQDFATSYDWITSNKELIYVSYRADSDGTPDPSSLTVVGKWIDPSVEAASAYEEARAGLWIKAKMAISPSNPGGASPPSSADSYTGAMVAALVTLDAVQASDQTPSSSLARIEATLAIRR